MTRTLHASLGIMLMSIAGLAASPADVPLIDAVRAGDSQAIRSLLRDGTDVDAPSADGTTALHWAVYRDDVDAVDLLVRAGAAVDSTNRYGVTPLSMAASSGYAAIVERLLEAGANPSRAVSGGETPLISAARTGDVRSVEALLARGADVNAGEDTRGQTALMWAAGEGHAPVIRALLDAGADLHATSHGPATVVAGGSAYDRGVSRLDTFTPFLFAVRAGRIDAVRTLLESGANPNATASDGTSALTLAAANAHWELGALLLDAGADPNAAEQGWAPLHQVIRTRNLNIGFFPHPQATGSMSSFEFAEQLLDGGADVNARIQQSISDGFRGFWTWNDVTPLVFAAKGADAKMMRLLVKYGADPTLSNRKGTTPLMAAAGVEMFNPNEDSGTNEEGLAAVEVALELGNDVNATNSDGDTPMHGAAWRGSNEIILRLVEAGAELNLENNRGYTPLQIANGEEEGRVANINVRPWTVTLMQDLLKERGLPYELSRTNEERFAFEKKEAVTRTGGGGRAALAARLRAREAGGDATAPEASELDVVSATAFLGNWMLALDSAQVPIEYAIHIADVGGKVGAVLSSDLLGESVVTDIKQTGGALAMSWNASIQGMDISLSMTLTPDGEGLKISFDFAGMIQLDGVATKVPD